MPLIGTAGHVDHGKSTLVQALTGRDPDRWEIEKSRGLTIDLGFAWMTMPGGETVSFVDVPGHERYLKNMLAGIEAIDVALFVVAADEGWMPQSEEHLAVLDLLEVDSGVVALTKIDAIDHDLAELAAEEVRDKLAGTSLADVPIVPVSARTRTGLEELVVSLEQALPVSPSDKGRPRLWIDRVFAAAGAGTVVTGTLLDGAVTVGGELELMPQGLTVRVRGLQSHEQQHESVGPGRRVAINLSGVSHQNLDRGDMLGVPGHWLETDRVTAEVRSARYSDEITGKGDYQMHVGSAAHRVRIQAMRDGIAVLQLDRPLPLVAGDRFILRDTGRKLVTAGGRVLDPAPPKRARLAIERSRSIDPRSTPDEIATALLAARGVSATHELTAHSGGGSPVGAMGLGGLMMTMGHYQELVDEAVRLVTIDHDAHPLRHGLSLATLAKTLDLPIEATETIVAESSDLTRVGPDVSLVGHQTVLTAEQVKSWEKAERMLATSLSVPSESELELEPELIALKLRSGSLVRLAPGLVYLADQLNELREAISGMGDAFTVSQFRNATGLSRKYAVPILEWADKEGLTVRRGDIRSVR